MNGCEISNPYDLFLVAFKPSKLHFHDEFLLQGNFSQGSKDMDNAIMKFQFRL